MFRLSNIQIFMGLNIHCGFPAIAGRLEPVVGSPAMPVDRIAALQPYFVKLLPGLASTEFVPALEASRAPDPPAALAMTLAWLTAQLQNQGSGCVSQIATARMAKGEALALSEYQVPEVAAQAMQLAWAFISAGWASLEPAGVVSNAHSSLQRKLAEFLHFAQSWHLDVVTHSIVAAARARNIPHYRICSSARFVQLGQGVHLQHIYETVSDRTSEAGAKIAHNKVATHHLLRSLGVPTADQVPVTTFEHAAAAAAQIGFPVVVKPSHGMQTLGVTVDIRDQRELRAAYQAAAETRLGGILVERFVPGHHYRLLVIDGRLVTVVRWIPAQVVGDGVHTIEELLALANQDPQRGNAYGYEYEFGKKWVRMAPNPEMSRVLAGQGYGYSSVPPQGRTVRLHGTLTIASGGGGVDVSGEVHPDVREMAELIARAFKLDTVGIDYLSEDVARTYRNGGGAVCEVNGCPGLRGHWLIGSDRQKILGALLQRDFPAGQTGRVPTVVIAGSAGAATVARMVAHILEQSGRTTALAFSGGVTIGARQVRAEGSAGGERARAVLMDPRVEAAVMELGCGSLLAAGMPVDACDVGAVLDVDFERGRHRGIDSADELAAIKSLVPKTAFRYAVLNADDARCASMATDLRKVAVCWVSVHSDNPVFATHREENAMTVTLAGTGAKAEIVIATGARKQSLVRLRDVPATLEGTTRVTETLFAAAITCALAIPCEHIRSGLISFRDGATELR